ncbi:MAG: tRNA (adenosine(37)-N6)-threonylcarbamoyltransferase complex ATPase subunit type 1 TsaE [Clostridia bacterium]|nr:tRNA (adenosine(37)-N6)-threonylcarbamoyltransferase complex ATPase subunit type 1 TsaE [Clostridia bacterium]
MAEKVITSSSVEETEAAGKALGESIADKGHAFVALFGDLGAGKTAFTRGIVSVLSPGARVHSPTYTIVNDYSRSDLGYGVYHFDMYRVTDEENLYSTGYYDYLSDRAFIISEWCENITDHLPDERIEVYIEYSGEGKRRITEKFIL